ncbi:MAG: response regulator [Actinomycetota bacterium]
MTIREAAPPVRILLVEDDPGDVLLIREALAESCAPIHIEVASNGEEAIEFLAQEGAFGGAERPDLVLLDLNLPRLGGLDVLKRIKHDDDLRSIPVVVLTTSRTQGDVQSSYELHANAYVSKPVEVEQFLRAVRGIDHFFVKVALLPKG